MKIDAHVHAFPDRLLRAIYDWFEAAGWDIPNPPDGSAIMEAVAKTGCQRAFVLCYSHKAGVARSVNRWLHEFALSDPRVVPVGCVHPADPDLADIVREAFDTYGFLGIKLHCNVGRFTADDPGLDPLYAMARERGKLLVIHAGTAPLTDSHVGLGALARTLERFPGLRVQVPHLGLHEWGLALDLLERHATVTLDTANVLESPELMSLEGDAFRAALCEAIRRFPDRFLYGSDYPILEAPLGLGLERLEGLALGREITELVLGGNAQALIEASSR